MSKSDTTNKDGKLIVRVSEEMRDWVRDKAAILDCPMSQIVRDALRFYKSELSCGNTMRKKE